MLGGIFGLSSNTANLVNIGAGNWASAASDLLGMAGGGLLDTSAADAAGAAAGAAGLADTTAPLGAWPAWPAWARCRWPRAWARRPWSATCRCRRVGPVRSPRWWARAPRRSQTVGWTAAAPQAGTGGDHPGDARDGRGRAQQRRLRCAALRRQADRHAETDGRLGSGHQRSTSQQRSEIRQIKGTGYRNGF